jgi:hypothetical protein
MIEFAMEKHSNIENPSLQEIVEADGWARELTLNN